MEKLFEYFAGSIDSMSLTLIIIAMSVLLIFIFLLMYIPALTRKILPHFGYVKYSDYLPFDRVYKDDSLSMNDGSLVRVYKIGGDRDRKSVV